MPTFKVDDCFAQHPKVLGLLDQPHGAEALALWVLAGSYCARYLTNGCVTLSQLQRLSPGDSPVLSLCKSLVSSGLWAELSPGDSRGDYLFHDWGRWNESRAEVELRREKDREKKRKQRLSKQNVSPGDSPPPVPGGVLDRIGEVKDLNSEEAPRPTRAHIAAAFARHYEARRGMLWNASTHSPDIEDIAAWVDSQGNREGVAPKAVGQRLLENWFGHKWGQKCDFKPKELLKNIGEVYAPPAIAVKDEPDPEAINARRLAAYREERDQELQKRLAGHADTAAPPPGSVADMLAGIGRKVGQA